MYRTVEWAVAYMQHVRFTMSSVYSCTVIRTGPGGAIAVYELLRSTVYIRLRTITIVQSPRDSRLLSVQPYRITNESSVSRRPPPSQLD